VVPQEGNVFERVGAVFRAVVAGRSSHASAPPAFSRAASRECLIWGKFFGLVIW
jgi:hypothetical protein